MNHKGDTVVCIRIESEKVFSTKFQSWLHRLDKSQTISISNSESKVKMRTKLEPYMLDYFFRRLHDAAPLNEAHHKYMQDERKMSTEEIAVRGYCSFPEKPWNVAKFVLEKLPQLEKGKFGIPGFYKNKYGWNIAGSNGIMIPYRNEFNEVVGYQIRVDDPLNDVSINKDNYPTLQARVKKQPNLVQILDDGEILFEKKLTFAEPFIVEREGFTGEVKLVKGQRYFWLSSTHKNEGTGAGNPIPIHIAIPSKELNEWETQKLLDKNKTEYSTLRKAASVWVTEGALKADIAVEHLSKAYSEETLKELGTTMLATPGVNSWRMVIPVLEAMEVKMVNIAFDMDSMRNEQVALQLKEMLKELKKMKIHVNMVMWNIADGKGIDDVFCNLKFPQIKKMF
ncbi:DUF3854 domain-containing protein [Rummeliibacillus stabekisii]|uniref:DUF3854 domain-containing protein n=1 Tax=Rummeliibacillus stabekisii TaxID=241244 RepID=UPI001174277D|nr:DUF3854 domain-containing protein [Rummeliibacillus stabekisii]MBB5171567.1 hypothetical protein [Rummeliibacillus stabekisii]GEL05535.1 topoisomerase [Rummeliibacillus stabekisii]